MATVQMGTRTLKITKSQRERIDAIEEKAKPGICRVLGQTEGGTLICEVPKHVDRTERLVITDTGKVV